MTASESTVENMDVVVVRPATINSVSRTSARQDHHPHLHEQGFSVIELISVMALATVVGAVAILNLRSFDDPLTNGSAQFVSFLKQVRARAISSTSAYIVHPSSTSRITTERALTCTSVDREDDDSTQLQLPQGASLDATDWEFCFNSRGMPDSNIEIALEDVGGDTRTIEVLLGGAVRIQ